jgi:hypothetical protein
MVPMAVFVKYIIGMKVLVNSLPDVDQSERPQRVGSGCCKLTNR